MNRLEQSIPSRLFIIGRVLIVCILLVLLILGWVFSYPDTLSCSVTISTDYPPVLVNAKATTTIEKIYCKENQVVEQGQLLFKLKSETQQVDINKLQEFISKISGTKDYVDYLKISVPSELQLGSFQNEYSNLVKKCFEFQSFLKDSYVFQKMKSLEIDLKYYSQLENSYNKEKTILEEDLDIAHKNLVRQQDLNESGAISDLEAESAMSQEILKRKSVQNVQTTLILNRLKINSLKDQIEELKSTRWNKVKERVHEIEQIILNINSQIHKWEETFLVKAPISGFVVFSSKLYEDLPISSGQSICNILPSREKKRIVANYTIPVYNSGDLNIGSSVSINLDAYPDEKFGSIKTEISEISLMPFNLEGQYFLKAKSYLPDTLISTYNIKIPFSQNLSGNADIIMGNQSYFQRIRNKLFKKLK